MPLLIRLLLSTAAALLIGLAIWMLFAPNGEPDGLSVQIRTLVDPDRNLTFEEVAQLQPEQLEIQTRADVTWGYTRSAIWLRIEVESDRDRTALLSLSPNFVDQIDIYVTALIDGERRALHYIETGDHRPLPQDGISGLEDQVELDLKAGEPSVSYVRLAAIGSSQTLHVQVYPLEESPSRTIISILLAGIWFGGMAVLIVIQCIFFSSDRRPRYLLLALSALFASVVYTGTLGFSRVLFFPEGGVGNDIYVSVPMWLSLSASTMAAAYILELDEGKPWLFRVFAGFAVIGVIGAISGASGQQLWFAPFGAVASMAVASLATFLAIRSIDKRDAATQLRAAAYSVLWIGVIAIMLQRPGLVNLPNWTAHTYAASSLIQTILLTAALSVRLRAAETINATLQQQALAEARSQQQQVRLMEVISHQYRTPLAAIRYHADNIGFSLPADDSANHGRLDRVRKGIARLVEVLEVNLSRARIEGPSFRPTLQSVPVALVVAETARRATDLLQGTILTEIADDVGGTLINADVDMLSIAIINLLENAEKFSRSKGGSKLRDPIRLSCRVKSKTAVITVTDTGIGIAAADIETIFEPTQRGRNASDIEGSGMGLSLVARIVAAHGGVVRAASVPGQQTSMTIELPLLSA